jgi:hypothetical protein
MTVLSITPRVLSRPMPIRSPVTYRQPPQDAVRFGMGETGKKAGFIATTVVLLGLGGFVVTQMPGCSPQTKSYWTGAYTDLPEPPENFRLQTGSSTEDDGTVFINYVLWDQKHQKFYRADIHYTTENRLLPGHSSSFREMGGYKQRIVDGEVLTGGVIVDQASKTLILPDGNRVDGPTGNIFDKSGNLVKKRGK